ncbi:CinA family protein [Peptoniphilus sp. GNH]|nr:competence/damage-inducible protein CinA domain protein [Clostridiales bacterium KA00134]UHR03099.1 CinA family protein [Peptoniphilus sp. GNH]
MEKLVDILKEKGLKISFAESMTGGLLAADLTSYPGASNVFKESFVTYSNESKNINLNVSLETLDKKGAVSLECAYEMAKGLRAKNMCDIAISITGEAGPVASEKTVGLVYYSIYFDDKNYIVNCLHLDGDRNKIRKKAVEEIAKDILFEIGGLNGKK